jgi:hypothetical protein
MSDPNTDRAVRAPSQATFLVQMARQSQIELFRHDGECYVTFWMRDHYETHPMRSSAVRRYLTRLYRANTSEAVPGAQALKDAVDALEADAVFDGEEQPVFTRVGEHEGRIYLDLANDAWEVVEIDPEGWRVRTNPPVRFIRQEGMYALPHPEPGGSIEALRPFLNIESDEEWHLLVSWIVAALRPRGPYPVLYLTGEQGCAKSTATRLIRRLVDPHKAELRDLPRDPRDFMIGAKRSWIMALDNLSYLPGPCSDMLCRLATGAAYTTRRLYSDEEETIFALCRPAVLNGIVDVVTAPDLIERTVFVALPVIGDEARRDDDQFWAAFDEAKSQILGALLDAVVVALRKLPTTQLARMPRMANFARWAAAAETGFGWAPGTFMAAYDQNRKAANVLALEGSTVARLVLELMTARNTPWRGTATELLALLAERARGIDEETGCLREDARRRSDWPKGPNALSNMLKRLGPNLRLAGVDLRFLPRAHGGKRLIELTPMLPGTGGVREADPVTISTRGPSPAEEIVTTSPVDFVPGGEGGEGGDDHFHLFSWGTGDDPNGCDLLLSSVNQGGEADAPGSDEKACKRSSPSSPGDASPNETADLRPEQPLTSGDEASRGGGTSWDQMTAEQLVAALERLGARFVWGVQGKVMIRDHGQVPGDLRQIVRARWDTLLPVAKEIPELDDWARWGDPFLDPFGSREADALGGHELGVR